MIQRARKEGVKEGERERSNTRSNLRIHRRERLLAFVALIAIACFLSQTVRAQTSPVYVGGGLTVGFNLHDLNVPVYRSGDTLCGVFQSGNSILPSGFLTFEKPLGDPAHSFWIAPRLHLAGLGALISIPAKDAVRGRDPNQDSALVPVSRLLRSDANILEAGLDLFVKYPVVRRLFLFGGPTISYLLQRNADVYEGINSPSNAVFADGTQKLSISSGQIENSTPVLAFFTLGASVDIPLSQKVVLAPELSARLPLNSLRSDYTWKVTTFALGAALKFDVAPEPKLEVVVPPPPPTPEKPKSEMSAKVKIAGVVTEASGEHELPAPQFRVEEFERVEAYPTLNYILFEEAKSDIPRRYELFQTPAEADSFDVKTLSGRSTLQIYHNELNILGSRLRQDTSITITLTGTNSNEGFEQHATDLSLARAQRVKQYLTDIWRIDPKRITVRAQDLPANPSSIDTKEGQSENRRVEITSNDPAFLDPLTVTTIDRTMNPPKIRVHVDARSLYPLTNYDLTLHEASRNLVQFHSHAPVLDWTPTQSELPRSDSGLVATLRMRDSLGTEYTVSDTAHIEQLTVRRKREERVKDKIVEHYNLITFDFDKADLDSRSQRVISEIAQSVTQNDKIVIRGYTDMTGERAHNLELSQARAKAVEAALRSALGDRAASVTLETQGQGENDLVDNRLPEGRFLSRTVFVELQKPVQ